jgi:signal recognition particle subunit SRP54
MFESLSDRLGSVVSKLRNRGRLSEADVDEIRTALLEADVNVGVVSSVLARIRDKAVGVEVSKALDPAQQFPQLRRSARREAPDQRLIEFGRIGVFRK